MIPNLPDNWIKYFELQDEWVINQSKLYNGDLRDMESRQCKNCTGRGGCLWCIVKEHASSGIRIPLITGGTIPSDFIRYNCIFLLRHSNIM